MYIIFTRSNNPISKAILFLTKEPMSHVAIEIGDFIIQSNLKGTNLVSKEKFHGEIVAKLPISICYMNSVLGLLEKRAMYDYPALLYLGLRYTCKRLFGWSIPKANLWSISGIYTCTEFVTFVLSAKEDSLITPYQLYLKLGGSSNESD